MKLIVQSRVGEDGTCFRACLASILNLKESDVPDFQQANLDPQVNEWLGGRGLQYRQVPATDAPPKGYHTIEGLSPRGGQHAVVGYGGRMVWDPHPQDGTGRGLVKKQFWGLLEPAEVMPVGDRTDMMQLRKNTQRQGGPFLMQVTEKDGSVHTGPPKTAALDVMPVGDAKFKEEEHPRKDDGKFGKGGVKSSTAAPVAKNGKYGGGIKSLTAAPVDWSGRPSSQDLRAVTPMPTPTDAGLKRAGRYVLGGIGSNFAKTEKVDPRVIQSAQPAVDIEIVKKYMKSSGSPPLLAKYNGQYIVVSGNHRSAAAFLAGRPLTADVVDMNAVQEKAAELGAKLKPKENKHEQFLTGLYELTSAKYKNKNVAEVGIKGQKKKATDELSTTTALALLLAFYAWYRAQHLEPEPTYDLTKYRPKRKTFDTGSPYDKKLKELLALSAKITGKPSPKKTGYKATFYNDKKAKDVHGFPSLDQFLTSRGWRRSTPRELLKQGRNPKERWWFNPAEGVLPEEAAIRAEYRHIKELESIGL